MADMSKEITSHPQERGRRPPARTVELTAPGADSVRAASRLYDAFAAHDAAALLASATPGFRGVVAAGMPRGLGGAYEGAEPGQRGV